MTTSADAVVRAFARTTRHLVKALKHDLGKALYGTNGGLVGSRGQALKVREVPEAHKVGLSLKMRS
jgi:hypothetical protein